MIQYLKTSWPTTMKWCVIAFALLAPGALIVLPILWLGRWLRAQRAPLAADQQPPAESVEAPEVTRQAVNF